MKNLENLNIMEATQQLHKHSMIDNIRMIRHKMEFPRYRRGMYEEQSMFDLEKMYERHIKQWNEFCED